MTSDNDFTVCLVGAGNMGGAMLSGWLDSGVSASRISVIDPNPPEAIAEMIARYKVAHHTSAENCPKSDVLVVAVKPQLMGTVLPQISGLAGGDTVTVSVAAGTTIATLSKDLGEGAIVRAMPNTPALVQRGITACYPNGKTSGHQRGSVDKLLSAIGKVEWVDGEDLIDAVTAVSGSGPAYVFYLAECMAMAGVEAGLPEDAANRLARETIAGAGEMLSRLDDSSSRLRQNVTSPNGTTAAALEVLMESPGLQDLIKRAVVKAKKRSEELSRG